MAGFGRTPRREKNSPPRSKGGPPAAPPGPFLGRPKDVCSSDLEVAHRGVSPFYNGGFGTIPQQRKDSRPRFEVAPPRAAPRHRVGGVRQFFRTRLGAGFQSD